MKAIPVHELREKILSGETTCEEQCHALLEEINRANKKFHHFCMVSEKIALAQARELDKKVKKGFRGKLLGAGLSVKDSICVEGVETRAGSKVLSGYIPPSSATVVQRALGEGAFVLGKTSQDEFGFGSYSVNVGVGFEVPRNPFDEGRACGGSSGGSAGFTSLTKFTQVSFGESTGGSIACPASFCGSVGLTPTYGRLSRHGLIDYGNSLDKIGPMAKTVSEAALLLGVSAGADQKDSTCVDKKTDSFESFAGKSMKGKTIGIVKDFTGDDLDKGVASVFFDTISFLEKEGVKTKEVSLSMNKKFAIPAYYLLSTPEASTNLARYCGMRYGLSNDFSGKSFDGYFSEIRSKGFGMEAKRRLMLGTFARMSGFRDAYYLRALKVRRKLLGEFKGLFNKVDFVVHPTMPFVAPTFSEIEKLTPLEHYFADIFLTPSNLGGFPHISVNAGFHKGMPVGFMFTADHFEEPMLVSAGSMVEGLAKNA
ncbi:MAG: Asp-tRNA(Asn)/Glu-tRNA(Gln) amidotransferase subunit GatA [Candidatus Diapherotrites archaeon]|nr:Asp-tRNA(Asn)/Glu-tRNA(Gln) amidotransferase subunit GatA [Candidatus Diapherotrites archaeon]